MEHLPVAEILRIAAQHGVTSVMVFGSRSRGDHEPTSDLDLLVDVEPGTSLFRLIEFEQALEDLLDLKVEVVTRNGLSPRFREVVLREAIPLDAA